MSKPVRGWADIAEGYRPVAMQTRKRSVHRPKVSVCIVANQTAHNLRSAIDSVLAQRFDDLEIVIVDNESPFVDRAILAEPKDDRLRVIRNGTALPLIPSFDLAVRHSRGQFVKLLCHNGTLYPNCLSAQAEVLEANHGVALVADRTDYIDDTGEFVKRQPVFARVAGIHVSQRVVKNVVRSGGNPIGPLPGAMFRRADYLRCGGFPTEPPDLPELNLWVRLLRCGDFFYMPQTLASVLAGADSTAASSLLLKLAERIEFTRQLIDDPLWRISASDRCVGHVKCCIDVVRGRRHESSDQPPDYRSTVTDSPTNRREIGDR